MALSTSIGLPPDTDSTSHWVKIISLTRESPARRNSLDCCFTVHLKVKPPLLRTKLRKWSVVNNFTVMAMSAESKTVIAFHRNIPLTEFLNPRLRVITQWAFNVFHQGSILLLFLLLFQIKLLAKCQGTRKLQHHIHFKKNAFSKAKNYTKKTKKNFRALACHAYQNCPIFRLQKLVRNWEL